MTSFFKSLESFASIAPTRETLDVVGQSNFHRVLPGAIQEAKDREAMDRGGLLKTWRVCQSFSAHQKCAKFTLN